MTKLEIVKQIARETGIEATTVSAVVEGFMEEVRAAQIRKENVFLRGFGNVGTAKIGTDLFFVGATPSRLLISSNSGFAITIPIPFAVSIEEPPPIAIR